MGYPMSAILILAKYLMLLPLQENLGSWQSKTLTQVEQNDQLCCWAGPVLGSYRVAARFLDAWEQALGRSEPQRAIDAAVAKGSTVRQSRAMASTRKPVIVRKFSRDWCAGYAGADFGQHKAELEFLDLTGKVARVAWEQVKWICYVRDFPAGTADQANPERLARKRFSLRPRTAGLWLRLTLGDGDELEGLAANDRSLVDGAGLLLTPPDTRSNTQRIYVPRLAIQTLEVVSLIGAAGRKRSEAPRPGEDQPGLFGAEGEGG
jgi:hypothetical protein